MADEGEAFIMAFAIHHVADVSKSPDFLCLGPLE